MIGKHLVILQIYQYNNNYIFLCFTLIYILGKLEIIRSQFK